MADGLRLYAATHDGVFVLRARDGRCEIVGEAIRGQIIDCVEPRAKTPGSVFAGDTHGGLYRTDDGGAHWRKLFDGHVRAIKVDPADDRVVYIGTEPVRLYRSEDAGEHWEEIESLQRLPDETRLKLGQPPLSAKDFANPKFRHGRQEWTFPIPPHIGHITEIFVRPDDTDEIWLSIEHGGIARSLDRGRTWEDASAGIDYLDIHKLIRLPGAEDRYVVSSARGLYASADPVAAGWTRAEAGTERNYFHEMMTLEPAPGRTPPLIVCTAEHSPARWPATMGDGKWQKGVTRRAHRDLPQRRQRAFLAPHRDRAHRAGGNEPDDLGAQAASRRQARRFRSTRRGRARLCVRHRRRRRDPAIGRRGRPLAHGRGRPSRAAAARGDAGLAIRNSYVRPSTTHYALRSG
jgi:hypothetical protein